MAPTFKAGLSLAFALALAAATTVAAEPEHGHEGARAPARLAARQGEPHPGPSGYQRAAAPKGWDARPSTVDRGAYRHNYQAARSFRVGPYHRPAGWTSHRWGYGEVLPRAYWAAPLVNTDSGEILQVEYGVFA